MGDCEFLDQAMTEDNTISGVIYLFIWLRQVLFAARGLFVVAHGLLSSCGVWVFSSLVVVRGVQNAWPL